MPTVGNKIQGRAGRRTAPIVTEDERSSRYWAYVFGANTRRVRVERRLTMNDVERELRLRGVPITASGLSLMERNVQTSLDGYGKQVHGHVQVTIDRAMAIAAVLGVPLTELLREDTL